MPDDRNQVLGKLGAAALADIAGIYGFSVAGAEMGALVAFSGGMAIAAAPALVTLAVMALVMDDRRMADLSQGADALAFTSPGTLALASFSPLFSPTNKPFLGATTLGPQLDFVSGILPAETIGEIEAAAVSYYETVSQPDYQRDQNEFQNYWFPPQPPSNSTIQGSAPGSPTAQVPGLNTGSANGGTGPFTDFYSLSPGMGDPGFFFSDMDGNDEGGDSSASSNGNGFTWTMIMQYDPGSPSGSSPVVDPPALPDPPEPPQPEQPSPSPSPPAPPPPPGDDDDDDDDDDDE